MDRQEIGWIQDQIGYKFRNPDLLQQAFVRRSWAVEQGGEHNELLAFLGDRVLELAVVRWLSETFGWMNSRSETFSRSEDWDEFCCALDEQELSEYRARLVQRKTLAGRMDALGLTEFLIVGRDEAKQQVWQRDAVRAELFEAVLGAVALDCGWDGEQLLETVTLLLDPEREMLDGPGCVEQIEDWTGRHGGGIPEYQMEVHRMGGLIPRVEHCISADIRWQPQSALDDDPIQYLCVLRLGDEALPCFRAAGGTKAEARKAACALALRWLAEQGLTDDLSREVGPMVRAESVRRLEQLSARGYFARPEYSFTQEEGEDGRPVWRCVCAIAGDDRTFCGSAPGKREARQAAAAAALQSIRDRGGIAHG